MTEQQVIPVRLIVGSGAEFQIGTASSVADVPALLRAAAEEFARNHAAGSGAAPGRSQAQYVATLEGQLTAVVAEQRHLRERIRELRDRWLAVSGEAGAFSAMAYTDAARELERLLVPD